MTMQVNSVGNGTDSVKLTRSLMSKGVASETPTPRRSKRVSGL